MTGMIIPTIDTIKWVKAPRIIKKSPQRHVMILPCSTERGFSPSCSNVAAVMAREKHITAAKIAKGIMSFEKQNAARGKNISGNVAFQ